MYGNLFSKRILILSNIEEKSFDLMKKYFTINKRVLNIK